MEKIEIVDVKISFAFKHPDPTKRFTWKSGRGSSLQLALQHLNDDTYNYWKEGEKEAVVKQFKALILKVLRNNSPKR